MPINLNNIRVVDKSGREQPLAPFSNKKTMVFMVVLCFIIGIFGGVVGMVLAVAAPDNVQKWLGISQVKDMVESVVTTEKVVVEEESATTEVVAEVSPAVVSILYTKSVDTSDLYNIYGQGQETIEEEGGGTGFIITADGLIVTNKHVVSDEDAKYTVVTSTGETYDATVVALDPSLDLAIIKIEATGLPVVKLGTSEGLQVGQRVIAIGNALSEFQNTVTVGVLSATGRSIVASDSSNQNSEELEGLLQTDAAINLGNSGGPLVNLRGQVIGINTVTASGDAEGIGFAIPIDEAKSAIESVQKTGKIVRPFLGVNTVELTDDIAKFNNLPVSDGFVITGDTINNIPAVVSGSPAEKAGLKEGDIIIAVNDEKVGEKLSLIGALRDYSPGDEVEITYNRDGDEKKVKVKLGERDE